MASKCPKCGEQLPRDNMKYCPKCGEQLPQPEITEDVIEEKVSIVLVLIIVLLLMLLVGLGVYYLKPDWFGGKDVVPGGEPSAEVTPTPETTPSPVPEVTPTPDPAQPSVIGTFVPNISNLRRRSGHSTSASVLDPQWVVKGQMYDVYEVYGPDAAGYTWYRIGEDVWVANNSSSDYGSYTPRGQ
ncbi:MAG: zinc ribbon domain-containing protein [Solobacterium sp.]|nr:zinc ribbon domain-containing protein [Solobacterium sp.]